MSTGTVSPPRRKSGAQVRGEQTGHPSGEDDAEQSAGAGEDNALSQQHPRDRQPAAAKGAADRELTRTSNGTRKQQRRGIDPAQDEHHDRRAQKEIERLRFESLRQ
jgi:hypothetical protein